jgi:hypothetical protein
LSISRASLPGLLDLFWSNLRRQMNDFLIGDPAAHSSATAISASARPESATLSGDQQLPAFHAFCDGDFALAGQQRHYAHFAQIRSDRIAGFIEQSRLAFKVGFFAVNRLNRYFDFRGFGELHRSLRKLRRCGVFENLDTVCFQAGERLSSSLGRVILGLPRYLPYR